MVKGSVWIGGLVLLGFVMGQMSGPVLIGFTILFSVLTVMIYRRGASMGNYWQYSEFVLRLGAIELSVEPVAWFIRLSILNVTMWISHIIIIDNQAFLKFFEKYIMN